MNLTETKYILSAVIVILLIYINCNCKYEFFKGTPTILYYYRDGCPYCVKFSPVFDQVAAENVKMSFRKINCGTPEGKAACAAETGRGMPGIPHVAMIKNGSHYSFTGARSLNQFRKFVSQ